MIKDSQRQFHLVSHSSASSATPQPVAPTRPKPNYQKYIELQNLSRRLINETNGITNANRNHRSTFSTLPKVESTDSSGGELWEGMPNSWMRPTEVHLAKRRAPAGANLTCFNNSNKLYEKEPEGVEEPPKRQLNRIQHIYSPIPGASRTPVLIVSVSNK